MWTRTPSLIVFIVILIYRCILPCLLTYLTYCIAIAFSLMLYIVAIDIITLMYIGDVLHVITP